MFHTNLQRLMNSNAREVSCAGDTSHTTCTAPRGKGHGNCTEGFFSGLGLVLDPCKHHLRQVLIVRHGCYCVW